MEAYKMQIKKRIKRMVVFVMVSLLLVAASYFSYLKLGANEHDASFVRGFQSGLFFAWAAIMLVGIIQMKRALKSSDKLKMMYIKEHDERIAQIQIMAKANAYWVCLLCIMVAAVVVGFFNMTAFYTLMFVLLFMGFVGGGMKVYYYKKL